jgi:hypothetical protein
MDDELRGVKGWLLTFVIIMGVISPAWSIFNVYRELYTGQMALMPDVPLVRQIRTFAWILVAVDAAICWLAVYRLVAVHNWLSVQIAIGCIWVGSVGMRIVEYVGVTQLTGLSFGDAIAAAGAQTVIQPVIFSLIWTAYLLKSQRVANTYRGGGEQAEVFE